MRSAPGPLPQAMPALHAHPPLSSLQQPSEEPLPVQGALSPWRHLLFPRRQRSLRDRPSSFHSSARETPWPPAARRASGSRWQGRIGMQTKCTWVTGRKSLPQMGGISEGTERKLPDSSNHGPHIEFTILSHPALKPCDGLARVFPKSVCGSPNPQYLKMGLCLDTGPLRR
ncbi:uncharacterized protein LOC144337948 [Macaca mulatta]